MGSRPSNYNDLSTTHTKHVQHLRGTLLNVEIKVLMEEIMEMETILIVLPINQFNLSGLTDLTTDHLSKITVLADLIGQLLEVPLVPLSVLDHSGKEDLKDLNLWMTSLMENQVIKMPL